MRLNQGYRAEIVRAALEDAFSREEKKLTQREHALAKRCYDALVPNSTRRWLETAPEGWLSTQQMLHLNVNGLYVDLTLAQLAPVPDKVAHRYRERLGNISNEKIAADVQRYLADREDIKARRKKAQATVEALIAQHVTTDSLAEAWPEGKAYWLKLERKVPVPNLPAVRIEELNAMLGLKAA